MLRRILLVPILGAIAALLFAGQAVAAPRIQNVTESFDFTARAGELCPFPVRIEATSGQKNRLPDKFAPVTLVTGPFVVTITNVTTGESITYNVSGSTLTSGNELTLTGPAVVLLFKAAGPPGPGLIYITGRGTIVDGLFQPGTFTGSTENVCETLA